jgi:translation elongation factor EF-1beta
MMTAMQTQSPSVDRLGAALRALRHAYAGESSAEDKIAFGLKCLHVLIAQLAQEGVAQEDLQPLIDLETNIEALKSPVQAEIGPDRRRQKSPSELLLARISAVIDLLVKAGYDEEKAAQLASRRMLAAGIPPPDKGGDARGWKRLLIWRENMSHGIGSAEAKDEYRDFTREIEAIPAAERLRRVLDEHLWDLRRK